MNPDMKRQVQTLLEEGLPVREVVRRTGASYGYVHARAVRMGRTMTRGHPNPPDHVWKHAKITNRKKEKGSTPP